jgi:hypothetical protein
MPGGSRVGRRAARRGWWAAEVAGREPALTGNRGFAVLVRSQPQALVCGNRSSANSQGATNVPQAPDRPCERPDHRSSEDSVHIRGMAPYRRLPGRRPYAPGAVAGGGPPREPRAV